MNYDSIRDTLVSQRRAAMGLRRTSPPPMDASKCSPAAISAARSKRSNERHSSKQNAAAKSPPAVVVSPRLLPAVGSEEQRSIPREDSFSWERPRRKTHIDRLAQDSVTQLERIVASYDASVGDPARDAEEWEAVQRGVKENLTSLESLETLLELLSQKKQSSHEIESLAEEHSSELEAIRESINNLRNRRDVELQLLEWETSAQLQKHHYQNANGSMRGSRQHRDACVSTVTPLPDIHAKSRGSSPSITPQDLSLFPTKSDVQSKARRRTMVIRSTDPSHTQRKSVASRGSVVSGVSEEESHVAASPHSSLYGDVVPPTGCVTLVYGCMKAEETHDVWEKELSGMLVGSSRLISLILRLCKDLQGYVVSLTRTAFFIAFQASSQAMDFCVKLQVQILDIDWSVPLLRFKHTGVAKDPGSGGNTIFRGPRIAMTLLNADTSNRNGRVAIASDVVTGRSEFVGPDANIPVDLAQFCRGGEILMLSITWESVKEALPPLSIGGATRLFSIKLSPIELQRLSFARYTHKADDGATVLIDVVQFFSFEHRARQALLGPHPLEYAPSSAKQEGSLTAVAPTSPSGIVKSQEAPTFEAQPSLIANASRTASERSLKKSPSSFREEPAIAAPPRKIFALNTVCFRTPTDGTSSTFIVVTVPLLASIMLLDCGLACWDTMMEVIDSTLQNARNANGDLLGSIVVKTFNEIVLLFSNEIIACHWAVHLQEALRHASWPPDLENLYSRASQPTWGDVWGGLRVAVGIASSVPLVSSHRSTGLFCYEGMGLSQARELACFARAGEVLMMGAVKENIAMLLRSAEYKVECLNADPTRVKRDSRIYAFYLTRLFQRYEAFGGSPKPEKLARLLANLHEVHVASRKSGRASAQSNLLAIDDINDEFILVARNMSATAEAFEDVMADVANGLLTRGSMKSMLSLLRRGEASGLVSSSIFSLDSGARGGGLKSFPTNLNRTPSQESLLTQSRQNDLEWSVNASEGPRRKRSVVLMEHDSKEGSVASSPINTTEAPPTPREAALTTKSGIRIITPRPFNERPVSSSPRLALTPSVTPVPKSPRTQTGAVTPSASPPQLTMTVSDGSPAAVPAEAPLETPLPTHPPPSSDKPRRKADNVPLYMSKGVQVSIQTKALMNHRVQCDLGPRVVIRQMQREERRKPAAVAKKVLSADGGTGGEMLSVPLRQWDSNRLPSPSRLSRSPAGTPRARSPAATPTARSPAATPSATPRARSPAAAAVTGHETPARSPNAPCVTDLPSMFAPQSPKQETPKSTQISGKQLLDDFVHDAGPSSPKIIVQPVTGVPTPETEVVPDANDEETQLMLQEDPRADAADEPITREMCIASMERDQKDVCSQIQLSLDSSAKRQGCGVAAVISNDVLIGALRVQTAEREQEENTYAAKFCHSAVEEYVKREDVRRRKYAYMLWRIGVRMCKVRHLEGRLKTIRNANLQKEYMGLIEAHVRRVAYDRHIRDAMRVQRVAALNELLSQMEEPPREEPPPQERPSTQPPPSPEQQQPLRSPAKEIRRQPTPHREGLKVRSPRMGQQRQNPQPPLAPPPSKCDIRAEAERLREVLTPPSGDNLQGLRIPRPVPAPLSVADLPSSPRNGAALAVVHASSLPHTPIASGAILPVPRQSDKVDANAEARSSQWLSQLNERIAKHRQLLMSPPQLPTQLHPTMPRRPITDQPRPHR